MMKRRWFAGWMLGALVVSAPGHAAPFETVLSGCADISKSGIYHLDRDIQGNLGAGCLRIHDVSDVQIDCHGHRITTDAKALAALVITTVKNFTVQACSLPQLDGFSMFVGNSSDGTVTRNEIKDMAVAVTSTAEASSLRVVGNTFTEFAARQPGTSPFGDDKIGVIPLQAGFNQIEASAMAVPDVPLSRDPGTVAVAASENAVRVFPNPWKSSVHQALPIRFDRLTPGSTVRLYSLSARWVKTLQASGDTAEWNLTNDAGERVASGYYLYLVTDPQGHTSRGKLAIIR